MTQEFYDKIMKAARFIKKGGPLRDVLDREDIETAILLLAKLLKEQRLEKQYDKLSPSEGGR